MKISVITVAYNSQDTIEETILSVASQTHEDVEYIVVDGGSEDGTLAIIDKHRHKIAKVISESDNGIYDAMNKGIGSATGEVIGFLNSDDVYENNQVLEQVAESLSLSGFDLCYADLVYVQRTDLNKVARFWKSSDYIDDLLSQGWNPPHPTFYARRSLFQKYGCFDLKFKISADYELMIRFLKSGVRCIYVPKVWVKMRMGGMANRSYANIIKANLENILACRKNGLKKPWLIIFKRLLSHGMQYLGRPSL